VCWLIHVFWVARGAHAVPQRYLRAAKCEIEEIVDREPYPDVEHRSRRSYILARRSNVNT